MRSWILDVLAITAGVVLAEIVIRSMLKSSGALTVPGMGAGGGLGQS